MAFAKQTLSDISLAHKTVLVRLDLDTRASDKQMLMRAVRTLKKLIDRNVTIVIIASRTAPAKDSLGASLRPIGISLATLLDRPVRFVDTCTGPKARMTVKLSPPGSIILFEDLLFQLGERENDLAFAKSIVSAAKADYYVQDALSLAHKPYASMQKIPALLPSVVGVASANELRTLTRAGDQSGKKIAIVGGKESVRKLEYILRLVDMVDKIIICGEVLIDFLAYKSLGSARYNIDSRRMRLLAEIYKRAEQRVGLAHIDELIYLPYDVITRRASEARPSLEMSSIIDMPKTHVIHDMGRGSMKQVVNNIEDAAVIVWIGNPSLAGDTSLLQIGRAIKARRGSAITIVLGVETIKAVNTWDKTRGAAFTYYSPSIAPALDSMCGNLPAGIRRLLDARPQIRYTKGKEA